MNIKYLKNNYYFWGDGENYFNDSMWDIFTKNNFITPLQANANFISDTNIEIVIECEDIPRFFQVENDGMFLYYKLDNIKKYQKIQVNVVKSKYKLVCSCSIDLWTTFIIPNWDEFKKVNFEFSRSPYLARTSTLATDEELDQLTNLGDPNYIHLETRGGKAKFEQSPNAITRDLDTPINTIYAVLQTNKMNIDGNAWEKRWGNNDWRKFDGVETPHRTIIIPLNIDKFEERTIFKAARGTYELEQGDYLFHTDKSANFLDDVYKFIISNKNWGGTFQGFYLGPNFHGLGQESFTTQGLIRMPVSKNNQTHYMIAYYQSGFEPFESQLQITNDDGGFGSDPNNKQILRYNGTLPKPYTKEITNVYLAKYEKYSYGDTPLNMSYMLIGLDFVDWKENVILGHINLYIKFLFNGQFIGTLSPRLDEKNSAIYNSRQNIFKYPQQYPASSDSYWDWVRTNQNTWDTGFHTNKVMGGVNAFGNFMKMTAGIGVAIASGGTAGIGAAIGGASSFASGITNTWAQAEMMKAKKKDAQNSRVDVQPTTIENIMTLIHASQYIPKLDRNKTYWTIQKLHYSPHIIQLMNRQLYYKNYYGYVVNKFDNLIDPEYITDHRSECHYYECCGEELTSTCLKFVSQFNKTFIPTNTIASWMVDTLSSGVRIWHSKIIDSKYYNTRERHINEYWTKD